MNVSSSTSASRYQAYDPADDDTPTQAASLNMCRKADNLAAAYICDEPVVTARVCTTTGDQIEEFVCDDKKMAGLQQGIVDTAKQAIKDVWHALVGKASP